MKPPRQITINPVLNGYIVQVGCQSLAFTTRFCMIQALDAYLADPEKVEKETIANALHKDSNLTATNRESAFAEAYRETCAPGDPCTAPYPGATAGRGL